MGAGFSYWLGPGAFLLWILYNFFLCISSMLLSSFFFSLLLLALGFLPHLPTLPCFWGLGSCAEPAPRVTGEARCGREFQHSLTPSGIRRRILLCTQQFQPHDQLWPLAGCEWKWRVTSRLKHWIDGVRLAVLSFPSAVISEQALCEDGRAKGGRGPGHWVTTWGVVALKNDLDPWWTCVNEK